MQQPRAVNVYTGLTSQSFAAEREKRNKRKQSKAEDAAQLKPYEAIVFDEIARLKLEVANEMSGLIHVDMSKTDIKSVVLGLRLAESKLTSLEGRLKNVLRGRARDEEPSDADL